MYSDAQKNKTIIEGNATAYAQGIIANASSAATAYVLGNTTEAYQILKTDLAIDPSNDLDKYIYYSNLQNADGPLFLYNIKNIFVKK